MTRVYLESPRATRDLRSTRSRLSLTATGKQEQATRQSPPVGPPRSRPLKAMASTSDGITTIVSPDGEILRRAASQTTSIEWFKREATKHLNYLRH